MYLKRPFPLHFCTKLNEKSSESSAINRPLDNDIEAKDCHKLYIKQVKLSWKLLISSSPITVFPK